MKKDKWSQGYACAIASLISADNQVDSRLKEAYSAGGFLGMGEKDMLKIGIDKNDIEIFKKHDLL